MLIGGAGALAGTTGTIVGTVVDALGDPISGVTVTLNDPGFTAKTNAAGEYVILTFRRAPTASRPSTSTTSRWS